MQGHLRIRASRTPYRRAGLAWVEEAQQEVPLRSLDGERFLALAKDPALRVEAWDGGRYRPIGELTEGLTADDMQLLIERFGALDEAEAPRPAADADGRLGILAEQNDRLARDLEGTRQALATAQVDLANARTEAASLREKADAADDLRRRADDAEAVNAELRKQLAAKRTKPPGAAAPNS